MKKIYLAGPEVFLPDAVSLLNHHKELCHSYGFQGLSPFDSPPPTGSDTYQHAHHIFRSNKRLIEESDIILANCGVFRGALVDDGTSFEIGYGFALGKKIFGYIEKIQPLPQIVCSQIPTFLHESGFPIDSQGYLVNENFGNTINLMLEFSILDSGGKLIEGNFERALQFLRESEN